MQKKLFLVLLLSLVFSFLSACSGTSATNSPETKKNNYDYPPAPTALMQANLTKIDGSPVKLNDYKGKILLINVWATWCGPCRNEIPELIELKNKHKEKGFEIVGLNLDEEETPEMITDFAKEFNINYDLLRGENNLFKEFYQISKKDAIPQSFLIDREGKLLGVFVGGGSALKKLVESVNKVAAE